MAAGVSDFAELPPFNLTLNITQDKCELAGKWFAATLLAMDFPLVLSGQYIGSLLPLPYNASNYTPSLLLEWWASLDFPIFNETLRFADEDCLLDVCQNELGVEGDPDIAGIGMMISYFLALALATIYFVVIAVDRILGAGEKHGKSWAKHRSRVNFSGFLESINAFVEASLVLALAIIAAAITRAASSLKHPDQPTIYYQQIGSFLMTVFSVLHAIMLQSLSDSLERRKLRLWVWSTIAILMITLMGMFGSIESRETSGWRMEWKQSMDLPLYSAQVYFNDRCDGYIEHAQLQPVVWTGVSLLVVNFLVLFAYALITLSPKFDAAVIRFTTQTKLFGYPLIAYKFTVQVINATACLTVMWWYLALFYNYRTYIVERTAGSNLDDKWTFGQVLAIATWASVFFDLANVYIYGGEAGLASKISGNLQIVRVDPNSMLDDAGGYARRSLDNQNTYNDTQDLPLMRAQTVYNPNNDPNREKTVLLSAETIPVVPPHQHHHQY